MMNPMLTKRIAHVQSRLTEWDVQGVLFFNMSNIRYLTGFTGGEGVLVLDEREVLLLVDGRYTTQARDEFASGRIIEYRDRNEGLSRVVSELHLNTVGFESSHLSFDSYCALRDRIPGTVLKPLSDTFESLRACKDPDEIDCLKKAARIAADALTSVLEKMIPGMIERDIAFALETEMRNRGSEKPSFDTIVASGGNAAKPHAEPGYRAVAEGESIVIDYGATFRGYHSDETCTVALGHVPEELRTIYDIVKEAHGRAIDAVRPGVACTEIDRIARSYIEAKGLGHRFSHGTGHGVGLDVHEYPRISPLGKGLLQEGMVITVEPGIYIPELLGVRIEDTVLVGRDGCEIVTRMPKDLTVL